MHGERRRAGPENGFQKAEAAIDGTADAAADATAKVIRLLPAHLI
jgi:hypothetical protein